MSLPLSQVDDISLTKILAKASSQIFARFSQTNESIHHFITEHRKLINFTTYKIRIENHNGLLQYYYQDRLILPESLRWFSLERLSLCDVLTDQQIDQIIFHLNEYKIKTRNLNIKEYKPEREKHAKLMEILAPRAFSSNILEQTNINGFPKYTHIESIHMVVNFETFPNLCPVLMANYSSINLQLPASNDFNIVEEFFRVMKSTVDFQFNEITISVCCMLHPPPSIQDLSTWEESINWKVTAKGFEGSAQIKRENVSYSITVPIVCLDMTAYCISLTCVKF